MKSFLNLILLLPLLVYALLLLINLDVMSQSITLNMFWLFDFQASVIVMISFFFIGYLALLWWIFKFSHFFIWKQNKKLQSEVSQLKSDIADNQEQIIAKVVERLKAENDLKLELYKKEVTKITGNMELQFDAIKNKLEKQSQK